MSIREWLTFGSRFATSLVGTTILLLVLTTSDSYAHAAIPNQSRGFEAKCAALSYVIQQHTALPAEKRSYSAYVIDDPAAGAIAATFSNQIPPVLHDVRASFDARGARHPKTGKPVKLWKAAIEKLGRSSAVVRVSWYSDPEASGSASYHLRLARGRWCVVSKSDEILS